ncbi:hypothetical protein [Roseibium sp. SCP14]|uniref:hypothetical protein n=1 Tax=Roseibium sp. SCP14 TaxID=3141375 RepID=UPI0033375F74
MAIVFFEPKDLRERRAELKKQDLDINAYYEAREEDKAPEPAVGPVEFFPMTDQEGDNNFLLHVNRGTEGKPTGAMSLSISELMAAFHEYLDFERSRELSEHVYDGYKEGTNPSYFYYGTPLDPIDLMEDRRNFARELISALKAATERLEAELPRYDAWIDNQEKKRKIRKDWPPYRPPRT